MSEVQETNRRRKLLVDGSYFFHVYSSCAVRGPVVSAVGAGPNPLSPVASGHHGPRQKR